MSVCRHQFFYLVQIDNFASSAAHNTPCAPALLEQLRELLTLTYVHGKRSWRGERWGISKKEIIATFSTFLFITSIFIPSPPPLSFPLLIPFYSNLSKIAACREEGITIQHSGMMILYGGGGLSNCLQGFPLQSRRNGRGI